MKNIIIKYRQPQVQELFFNKTDKIAYSPSYRGRYVYAKCDEDLPLLEKPVEWVKIGERYFRGVKYNKYSFSYPKGVIVEKIEAGYRSRSPLLLELLKKGGDKNV